MWSVDCCVVDVSAMLSFESCEMGRTGSHGEVWFVLMLCVVVRTLGIKGAGGASIYLPLST